MGKIVKIVKRKIGRLGRYGKPVAVFVLKFKHGKPVIREVAP